MISEAKSYKQIEHTADIGIQIVGSSLGKLFENAARALFDILIEYSVGPTVTKTRAISIRAADSEELLVNWLSELNFLFITEELALSKFRITSITNNELAATIYGEPLNPDKHIIHTEIKAVTFHRLYVRQLKRRWEAQVIFDI